MARIRSKAQSSLNDELDALLNGDESIALRWRYTSKRANNMSSTVTYSLINIYNTKEEGIWVAPFAEDSILKLPDEVQKLVDNILKDVLHAKQSKNKAVWTVGKEAHEIEDEDEDKDKDKDKDEDKDTDKDDESGKEKDDEKKSDKKSDVDDELDALLNGDESIALRMIHYYNIYKNTQRHIK